MIDRKEISYRVVEIIDNKMKVMTLWGEEEVESRKCMKCLENKPLDKFEIRSYGAKGHLEYRNDCKQCRKTEAKQRAELHKQYGHLRPQGNDYECPICNRNEEQITSNGSFQQTRKLKSHTIWALDHNHKTGEYRGWICNNCNVALGRLNDDINALQNAIKYLRLQGSRDNR